MQFICVVTASYTLGFLLTKNPGSSSYDNKISKQIFLVFLFMEIMLTIQFLSMEKMPCLMFHSKEKMLIMLFS